MSDTRVGGLSSAVGSDPIVATRIDGRVATVTIANPPANQLGNKLIAELDAAIDEVLAADARVVVIASGIDGWFAAGADLKLLAGLDSAAFSGYLVSLRSVIERLATLDQVTIAAIDGLALGGGLELALACTMRVASPRSKIGVPEVKLGLLPGAGGTQRLPRLIGRGPALDLLLTGRSVTGEEALALGLVDRVAPGGSVVDEALALASTIAAGPSDAIAAIVRCVDAARDLSHGDGMIVEGRHVVGLFGKTDATEGIAAFIEKRPAVFE